MATEDEDINNQRKKSSSRDPLSHRIIEKRRRDRMNNCLADLSRLIPTSYLKKGRGRIEKTEIIEMAIKHMKHLQAHKYCSDDSKCELSNTPNLDEEERLRQYRLGYQECLSEAIRFLVEIEGLFTGDGLCRRMMDFLQSHMTTLNKVNQSCNSNELEASRVSRMNDISKARSPSLSESTTSANEKMDVNDTDLSDCKPYHSKPVVTSHLREMLESSSITKGSKSSPNISFSSGASTVPSNELNPNSDQNVYNFKKEIKDRFQADQKVGTPLKSISPSSAGIDDERISNSSMSSLTTQASDHRSETSGYCSNSSSKSMLSVPSVFVPIFALHPSGHYYLPLTLEASLIAPLITKEVEMDLFPVLHPINITVNFSYQTPQMPPNPDFNRVPVWPSVVPQKLEVPVSHLTSADTNHKIGFNNSSHSENVKFDPIWLTSASTSCSKFSRMSNKIK